MVSQHAHFHCVDSDSFLSSLTGVELPNVNEKPPLGAGSDSFLSSFVVVELPNVNVCCPPGFGTMQTLQQVELESFMVSQHAHFHCVDSDSFLSSLVVV